MKKISILVFAAVTGIFLVSCCPSKSLETRRTGPAYSVGSSEFSKHTPPQFHQLRPGLGEAAVVETVGNPDQVSPLWALGQIGSCAGKRDSYNLDTNGVVWIDFDRDWRVTGVYWRQRD